MATSKKGDTTSIKHKKDTTYKSLNIDELQKEYSEFSTPSSNINCWLWLVIHLLQPPDGYYLDTKFFSNLANQQISLTSLLLQSTHQLS